MTESTTPQVDPAFPSLEADPSVLESSSATNGFIDKPVDETAASSEYSSTPSQAESHSHTPAPDVQDGQTNGNSMTDTVAKGPVMTSVMNETAKTEDEIRGLQDAKTTPTETASTGQPLTHYHSLFYSLLSWERPRATAVSYLTVVGFIFAARYLPLLRWAFKFLYVALGFTAALEIAGKVVLSRGLASSFRPRKYYTIPKDTVDSVLEDLEQLADFFIIEFQRVLFAENLVHTSAAFTAAFASYWLIRFVPIWGLALIGVSIAYLGPLIYVNNRELIDNQIKFAHETLNSQADQMKEMAGQQTAHATEIVKQYVGEYSSKAQEYVNSTKRRSPSPEMSKATPVKSEKPSESSVQHTDFPVAPKDEPLTETQPQANGPQPIAAS
ncbi:hypothetical protein FQN54_004528 [Arachnomyces sp. PD_36]|nr:hypothetical protein FQN54_004528 [Arachnomyces sp. PD_36]